MPQKFKPKKLITAEDKNKVSGRRAIIPEIGSRLALEQDWEFTVHFEHRNGDLLEADGETMPHWNSNKKPYLRTLVAGTEFLVDRIYIRNGMEDFSSVTLRIAKTTDEKILARGTKRIPFKKSNAKDKTSYGRFWVKLADFNKANMVIIDDKVLIGKKKDIKGEVVPFATLKNKSKKRTESYWVEFVDKNDNSNSFKGIVESWRTTSKYIWDLSKVPAENRGYYRGYGKNDLQNYKPYMEGATFTEVKPKTFFQWPLISVTWNKKNPDRKHPHFDLLCLSTDETSIKTMGMVDKTTPMENMKLGEGLFLSIYKIDEIEVMEVENDETA
jgi:hypothetical protein